MRDAESRGHSAVRAWVNEYIEILRAQRYAARTVSNYSKQLAQLVDYLDARTLEAEPLALEAAIDRYESRDKLEGRDNSVIRRFIRWSRTKNYLPAVPDPNPLPPQVEDYLAFCTQHRGLSIKTVKFQEVTLRDLADFLRERGEQWPSLIPLDSLDAFLDARSKVLSRDSLWPIISALRGFLKYLSLIGVESEDRSGWLEGPTIYAKAKLPRYLEDSQVEAALATVKPSTASGVRDWAILMILQQYGWRAGEVASLRFEDVDFERRVLHVRRVKGGTRQVFPLVDDVEDALRAYLKVRPESPHHAVFITVHAPYQALTAMAVSGRVQHYLQGIPGVQARGAHAFRHTLARRLRQAGAPLAVLSRVLGHSNLDSANSYIRIATDELSEVADNYAELL